MALERDNNVDSILQVLGPVGRFSKIQILLIWLGFIPSGIQLFSNIFIGQSVPHRCAPPVNESQLIASFDGFHNVNIVYDKCEIHIKSKNNIIQTRECLYGMEYDLPIDFSFVSQFGLVCGATNLARLTQSLIICGQAFGAAIGAMVADRLGRKVVIIGSNSGLLVAGLVLAYAPSFGVFACFKFIIGGFQQANLLVVSISFIELLVEKDRRIAASLHSIFWGSGTILLGVIAFAVKEQTWRTVQMVLSLPSVFVVVQFWFLREPLRWLMANGKTEKATDYIRTAAKINGKSSEEILDALHVATTVAPTTEKTDLEENKRNLNVQGVLSESARKMTYLDIFRIRRLLLNNLIMWLAWFTTALGFFAIYMESTSLAGDNYLNYILIASMEIPGSFIVYFGMNRFGRKRAMIFLYMMMSASLIGSGIFRSFEVNDVNSTMILVCSLISMIGASGCFVLVFSYTPELFPTNIRNQAVGTSSMVSRVGGMLAPFTGILSAYAKWAPGVLIGVCALCVAILLRFIPETNGRELPQTVEELHQWYKKDNKKQTSQIKNERK